MIIRELTDGQALAISQESHADVAAQFAAHWGNGRIAPLNPYNSMLFGVVYHDSGHREMEAALAINPETGLPYNFRGAPPEVRNREADGLNSLWIRQRDPYAALVVSMHHTGLRKRRYDTLRMRRDGKVDPAPGDGETLGADNALTDLKDWQREAAETLGADDPATKRLLWHNYKMLQVFDLLSLHFCCDGYAGDELRPAVLEGVPVAADSDDTVDIHIQPLGGSRVRFDPYPFDTSPLEVGVIARKMAAQHAAAPEQAQAAYYKGGRCPIVWQIVS
ncbi:MAG TPA: DUF3891 family protein [Chloroflexota bacterium]|nr:DUF3891 family protein [Chloroflexota bacterium]